MQKENPRYECYDANIIEGQNSEGHDSAVSKGYDCLVAVLLGSTENDGRMIRSPVIFTAQKRLRIPLKAQSGL